MLTLLDRLKPEYRKQLDSFLVTMPVTTGVLYQELRDKSFFIELTYESIHHLVTRLDIKGYSPVEISNLFIPYRDLLDSESYKGLIKSMEDYTDNIIDHSSIVRGEALT